MLYLLAATPAEDAANLVSQAENVFGLVASLVIAMVGFYLVLKVVRGIDHGYGSSPMSDDEYLDYLIENDLEYESFLDMRRENPQGGWDPDEAFSEKMEAREDAWNNMDDDEIQEMWDDSEWDDDD